jgi:hypothetical protein
MNRPWLAVILSVFALTFFVSRTASAQLACPSTVAGTIAATPTETGRITRDGNASVCGTAKGFPGMFDGNSYAYETHKFANRTGASACVTFTLTQPGGGFGFHVVGYSTFVPTNPAANYLGDSGNSSVGGAAVSMNLTLSANEVIDVVVNTAALGSTGSYTLTASGCGALTTPTLALVSSANPSVWGQSVTFTGSVTGRPLPATGTLTFFDGATQIGTATLNGAGSGSMATSALTLGSHSITYQYSGDFWFAAGTSGVLTQQVNAAQTTTALVSSVNPTIVGGGVTFTATVAPVAPGAGTPTGTVTFFDGATSIGMGTLAGGVATFTTSALAVGTHPITAVYGASADFSASTSTAVSQVVNQDGTTVAIGSSSNPSTFGTSVTFTATASTDASGGIPTGTMTFFDGPTQLGVVALDPTGSATFATSTLTGGSHSIAGVYSGDVDHVGASASLTQVVTTANSSTALASATNPSIFGQSVTFTATVSGVGGTATGTVTFFDGATSLGTGTVDGAGQASFSTGALAVGTHPITAAYGGDTNFAASTSAAVSQLVNQSDTSTALASSSNPSIVGATLTFTASVTATLPGAGTPTGTVTFSDGMTILGTGTLNASGVATFDTTALDVGTHVITASYAGDASFHASTTTLSQVVNQDGDTTALVSSQNPSTFGASVTFTATVTTSGTGGTPTGTITFDDGGTVIGTGTLTAGVATFSTATLAGGTHTITATYSGDTDHAPSSGSVMQVVTTAGTATALASSTNPSVFGQSITITATVTSGAGGVPTGTVTFSDGVTTLGTGTLDATGATTFTTSALAVATHALSAVYGGDANYTTSTATTLSQVVNQADTSTAVASSSSPSLVDTSVTFTATVTPTAPGAGAPTGTVTFMDGSTTIGTGTLGGAGVATFATTTLTVGAHSITAVYGGDGSFVGSTSSAFTQNVTSSAATLVVTAAPAPSTYGTSVTFTATLTGSNGAPTGTVAFTDGANALGTGTLAAGVATFSTATLTAGTHTITATYSGDATYATGTGTVTQVVAMADTTTTLTSSKNPSNVGDGVTFTATVASPAAGFTGHVEFLDGTTSLGTVALSGATAAFTSTSFTQGGHSVTAKYDGDTNFAASTSTALTETVNGTTPDGGTDAGGDGGASADGGDAGDAATDGAGGSTVSGSGCGCRTVPYGGTGGASLGALAGLGLLIARRRRRA